MLAEILIFRRGTFTPTIPTPTSITYAITVSSNATTSLGESRPNTAMLSPPRPSSPGVTPTAMTVAQQMPSLPLASFYDAEGQIVWPADSPVAGDLKEKRSVFDQASQLALAETKKSGVASIATVTDARQKLLDYGRPALQYVRTHETPRVADGFHLFLLSLYESLAQAINPTATAAALPVIPAAHLPPEAMPVTGRHAALGASNDFAKSIRQILERSGAGATDRLTTGSRFLLGERSR